MSEDFGGMQDTGAEEYDFSADGLPVGEHTFTITDVEEEEKDKGTQLKVTYETEAVDFPIPVGYWIEHENPKAAKIGRGNLKKIALAALGQPKFSAEALKGRKVLATLSEDGEGFARIGRFKKVPEAVTEVALLPLGRTSDAPSVGSFAARVKSAGRASP